MKANINTHSPEYLPFQTMGIFIVMCSYGQIIFIYYDLKTCDVTHEVSLILSFHFSMPIDNQCTNIIESTFFPTHSQHGSFRQFSPTTYKLAWVIRALWHVNNMHKDVLFCILCEFWWCFYIICLHVILIYM